MRVRTLRPSFMGGAAMAVSLLLLMAASASAHQRQLLQIGAIEYLVVVGFINEPVYTGDKSGVDLAIVTPDPANPLDSRAPEAKPVEALEKSLKVEVKAGPHTKVFDLKPAYRAPGRYEAVFYPTVPTTYTFRFFGTLHEVPVDFIFSCNPLGHVSDEDRTLLELSQDVTRKALVGSFGCPQERTEAEFPPRRPQ
jgi:hypothetical protein